MQKFFNAPSPFNVIFTSGCTSALNLALLGSSREGGHVITTVYEHNSVLRVLEHLKNTKNITYTVLKPNSCDKILAQQFENAINKNTYLIAVNHTSNVTGHTQNITEIGKIAKKHNLQFLVDCAQSAGHENINMQQQNITMLAVAGHKSLLGPQGVGALITNNAKIKPIMFGGTGTNSESLLQPTQQPEAYESGTIATPNIIALGAGVKFVEKHRNKINNKITKNSEFLLSELSKIKHVKLHSKNAKSGVISFEVLGQDCNAVANALSKQYKIYIRSGLHCAPLISSHLNNSAGLLRVSFGYKNSFRHAKKFVKSLKVIVNKLSK